MKTTNPLHAIDFYKAGHRSQYPDGTTLIVSNFTPRSGKHAKFPDQSRIVFFGLQYFIKHFLMEVWQEHFFDKPKADVLAAYKRRMDTSLGLDSVPIDHIAALHELGFLPIEIRAVQEGELVPVGVPALTIHNTRPEFFWLTNYIESVLSTYLWLPCTSATTAWNYRRLLNVYANITGASSEFIDFQAHDFSFRGMSSMQSGAISGAAHLLFFKGTDTVLGIDLLEQYYNADCSKELIGCSVPATEHSVMCAGGEVDEEQTFRRLITKIYPKGIVSIVSDTWDFWKVLTEIAPKLKNEIMQREGKVVFRPDSGNPANIICGDPNAATWHPEKKGAVELLWDTFGGTVNADGYKELDPHVGLIYGDSITFDMANEILERLVKKGFASSNVVFGVGSFTYQYATRDTWGWAVKATFATVNGEDRPIFKNPKTDDGVKKSAKGLVKVVCSNIYDSLTLQQGVTWDDFTSDSNELKPVFRDGKLLRDFTLAEIRLKCM